MSNQYKTTRPDWVDFLAARLEGMPSASPRWLTARCKRAGKYPRKVELQEAAARIGYKFSKRNPAPGSMPAKPARDASPCKKSFDHKGDKCEASGVAGARITSLEMLVEFFEVDLEEWSIERWKCNVWEQASKGEQGSIITPLYQVKASMVRRRAEIAARDSMLELVELLRAEAEPRAAIPHARAKGRSTLAMLGLFDVHFGKYCDASECGADYDSKIAAFACENVVEGLLEKTVRAVDHVEQFIFPIGNDLLNSDMAEGGKTAITTNGTPQDEDTRFYKTFAVAFDAMRRAIERASLIAPVHLVYVPGNHDLQRALYLTHSLMAWFDGDKNVTVDASPTTRKYYRYGASLLGFAHGKDESPAVLPGLLLADAGARPHLSETTYKDWFFGHVHTKRERGIQVPTIADESHGIRMRWLPAISDADSWHAMKGFVGNRRAGEVHLFDREEGWFSQISQIV